jgi:predicted nucleic acid-binding protein
MDTMPGIRPVAAARLSSCGFLLTENFQAGQQIDGVVTVNPFRTGPRTT